ncbi:MAG: DUF3592 domain-containing protein [Phycisphaeraceae bacterium]|nr:DUF3592 domain-containing protein [Phycisphaeraceae bacterium]
MLLVVMLFRLNYDEIYFTYVSDRLAATQGRVQIAEWTRSGRGSAANKLFIKYAYDVGGKKYRGYRASQSMFYALPPDDHRVLVEELRPGASVRVVYDPYYPEMSYVVTRGSYNATRWTYISIAWMLMFVCISSGAGVALLVQAYRQRKADILSREQSLRATSEFDGI